MKKICTFARAGLFVSTLFFMIAPVVAGLLSFLWGDCSPT